MLLALDTCGRGRGLGWFAGRGLKRQRRSSEMHNINLMECICVYAHAYEIFKQRIVLMNYQKIDYLNHYVWVSCSVVFNSVIPWSPCSPVHEIPQVILAWVTIFFSRGSSLPRDQTCVFHIAGRFFTFSASSKALLNHTVKKEMYSFWLNNLVSNFASATLGKLSNLLELQLLHL